MNIFNIERAFKDKIRRNWDTLFVCVDVHDVILEGKYNLMNTGASYMPNALRVLQQFSKRNDIKLIMWTSSHAEPTNAIHEELKSNDIHFDFLNGNPACPTTDLCNFNQKFYFNILLDDKAGFEGATDWFLIEDELKRIGQWIE